MPRLTAVVLRRQRMQTPPCYSTRFARAPAVYLTLLASDFGLFRSHVSDLVSRVDIILFGDQSRHTRDGGT